MELLLLGTAHFESTGDHIQLSEEQKQNLKDEQFEKVVETLIEYEPQQIFVEEESDNQVQLHQFYVTNDVPESYKRNEIYRIAFPLARKLNLDTIYAVDWNKKVDGVMGFDEMMNGNDKEIIQEILMKYNDFLDDEDGLLNRDLIAYFRHLNNENTIEFTHQVYVEMMEASDDAFEWVTRYWYYRNLKIVQLLKRAWQPETERALLLIGAGHNYLVHQQILDDPRYNVITYNEWMNK